MVAGGGFIIFDFIKKIFYKQQKPNPKDKSLNTTKVTVLIDQEGVRVTRMSSKTEEIKWNDIGEISIITTSEGPFMEDVYLCLSSIDGKYGCAVPSMVEGYIEVYDRVSKFEGFNFQKVIEAMSCTTDAKFIVWEKCQVNTDSNSLLC